MDIEDFGFDRSIVCPNCKEPAKHLRESEYRCTSDSDECNVLYFIKTNYQLDDATM